MDLETAVEGLVSYGTTGLLRSRFRFLQFDNSGASSILHTHSSAQKIGKRSVGLLTPQVPHGVCFRKGTEPKGPKSRLGQS